MPQWIQDISDTPLSSVCEKYRRCITVHIPQITDDPEVKASAVAGEFKELNPRPRGKRLRKLEDMNKIRVLSLPHLDAFKKRWVRPIL